MANERKLYNSLNPQAMASLCFRFDCEYYTEVIVVASQSLKPHELKIVAE